MHSRRTEVYIFPAVVLSPENTGPLLHQNTWLFSVLLHAVWKIFLWRLKGSYPVRSCYSDSDLTIISELFTFSHRLYINTKKTNPTPKYCYPEPHRSDTVITILYLWSHNVKSFINEISYVIYNLSLQISIVYHNVVIKCNNFLLVHCCIF